MKLEARSDNARSRLCRSILALLVALTTMGGTSTLADGMPEDLWAVYQDTADEVNAAAEMDLGLALAPFRPAGGLNRDTPEFQRVRHLFARVIGVALQRSDLARKLDWALYVHEGRFVEAYSRAGGKIIIFGPISGTLSTD